MPRRDVSLCGDKAKPRADIRIRIRSRVRRIGASETRNRTDIRSTAEKDTPHCFAACRDVGIKIIRKIGS